MDYYRLGLVRDQPTDSFSPAIFEWAFRATGLRGEYRLYRLSRSELHSLLRQGEWDGLNVTIPHKTQAFSECDETTPRAQQVQAVNTLSRREGCVHGDNTDIPGFEFALQRALPPQTKIKRTLVIGTGGAARAVLAALSASGLSTAVSVATRDVAGARARLSSFAARLSMLHIVSLADAAHDLPDFDLIVQATPVDGTRVEGLPLPAPLRFKPTALVMDLIYRPAITPFLAAAHECGARTENGLVMLIAQAAESFTIWTGTPFPLERALEELLPQLREL